MMKSLNRLQRKARLLITLFITRKLVVTRHADGSPELVIRYLGDERFIRELSRINHPPKKNPNQ